MALWRFGSGIAVRKPDRFSMTMQTSNFDYELPSELIAQHPPQHRSGGRLLSIAAGIEPVSYTHLTLPTICSV